MIQRIQSVYLLLVTGLLILAMAFPVGTFVAADGAPYTFTNFGVNTGVIVHSTWGLFGLLLISAILAFGTIFLFRNRMLQIRISIFNAILMVGYYLSFAVFVYLLKDDLDASYNLSWALGLPLIALILNYLAIRAIGKDEVLVRATDRLR
ncbi:MAG: DUF4293 domain-containing protein [Bacteroides sp.]|nr:DUF4293 domain-containing protein [Bacteroides sp.]